MKTHIPEHPELLYRISGEWRGWHDFLGPQSQDDRQQDELEDEAFRILKRHPEFSDEYTDETISLWKELVEQRRR